MEGVGAIAGNMIFWKIYCFWKPEYALFLLSRVICTVDTTSNQDVVTKFSFNSLMLWLDLAASRIVEDRRSEYYIFRTNYIISHLNTA